MPRKRCQDNLYEGLEFFYCANLGLVTVKALFVVVLIGFKTDCCADSDEN